MNVNFTMARLLRHKKKAEALFMKGKYLKADEKIAKFVEGCAKCYRKNNTRDGARVAAAGYTGGAAFYGQMFSVNGNFYSFNRHEQARKWADEGIRLSYKLLCDDRDNGRNFGNSVLYFVSTMTTGFAFGKSPCVKEHIKHSDTLIEKLVNGNPQNQELKLIRKNYYEARESAEKNEELYNKEFTNQLMQDWVDEGMEWCLNKAQEMNNSSSTTNP